VLVAEAQHADLARRRRERTTGGRAGGAARDAVVSPMQGTVLAVRVGDGDDVTAGDVLCIVEAMKMENEVHAPRDGVVSQLSVADGQPVKTGQAICVISSAGAPEADAGVE
jgi:acetyl-CoA/propionyl-CoA carboxylase biotin carboxyl carrier protein